MLCSSPPTHIQDELWHTDVHITLGGSQALDYLMVPWTPDRDPIFRSLSFRVSYCPKHWARQVRLYARVLRALFVQLQRQQLQGFHAEWRGSTLLEDLITPLVVCGRSVLDLLGRNPHALPELPDKGFRSNQRVVDLYI